MYHVELTYYPLMISLNKYIESCNVLSQKIYVPKETKHIYVQAFNMIINKDEAKSMAEHIPSDCKCKLNSRTCNCNQK